MRFSILIILMLLLVAGAADAVVRTDPTRIDVDPQPPGATFERMIQVRNQGDGPTHVAVEPLTFEGEEVEVEPASFDLDVGDVQDVLVRIHLAPDASGGRHDVRLMFVEGDRATSEGVSARAAVRVPVIFQVENLKVAGLTVEDAGPGESGSVQAMVFNHLDQPIDAVLHAVVRDAEGREVARYRSGSTEIPPEEHRFLGLDLEAELGGGVLTVDAWAEHSAGASNTRSATYLVGVKDAQVGRATLEVLDDGLHRLRAQVTNTGTVPLDLRPSFRVIGPDGEVTEFQARPMALEPDQRRDASVVVRLEPGEHQIVPVLAWSGGGAEGPASTIQVQEGAASSTSRDSGAHPLLYALAGLSAGTMLMLVLRRRPKGGA